MLKQLQQFTILCELLVISGWSVYCSWNKTSPNTLSLIFLIFNHFDDPLWERNFDSFTLKTAFKFPIQVVPRSKKSLYFDYTRSLMTIAESSYLTTINCGLGIFSTLSSFARPRRASSALSNEVSYETPMSRSMRRLL